MTKMRPLLIVPLFLLLTACGELFGGPPYARLSLDSFHMQAVTSMEIPVDARGSWNMSSNSTWLDVSPSQGNGSGTVTLTADTSRLVPGEHSARITISAGSDSDHANVRLSFPRLRGTISMGGGVTSAPESFSTLSASSGPGTLLVGLRDHDQPGFAPMSAMRLQSIASDVASLGSGMRVAETYESLRIAAIDVPDISAAIARLEDDPRVRYASPTTYLQPLQITDPGYEDQWALERIDAESAWSDGSGLNTKVAVIDVGIYPQHSDLDGNVDSLYDTINESEVELKHRPACIEKGTHGTHVAGIIAAEANGAGVVGVAHEAGLVLINVGDDTGTSGGCRISSRSVVDAIDWLLENPGSPKADIINISLGGPYDAGVRDAVREAYREGVSVIAASGNDEFADVLFPAAYPEVLAVSSTDFDDDIASYSTTGPEVYVSAPGGGTSDSSTMILSTIYDARTDQSGYGYMSGTSMASPAVAGVAALLKEYEPTLNPIMLAGLLADSSHDLGDPDRDDIFGYGRLDAGAAMALLKLDETAKGYVVRIAGDEYSVPAGHDFDLGYVGIGELVVEASTNDTWDTDLQGSGEYYGTTTVDTTGKSEVDLTVVVEEQ